MAIEGASTPIGRFDLRGGGTLTLYPGALLERGAGHFDMLPLAAVVALRVSFERDRGRIGWGAALIVLALLAFAVSGPLGAFAGGAADDIAGAAGSQGVARALQLLFRFMELGASLLPAVSIALAIGGGALVAHGWRGSTVLALTLAGTERVWASRGQDKLLLDFAELVGDRLLSLER